MRRQRSAVGGFLVDLRQAGRALRSTPTVTAVAILSLAFGIGANTAVFALVDSLLLRTLPIRDSDRVVLLTDTDPGVRAWSYPVWNYIRQEQLFEHLDVWSPNRFNLAARGETQFVDGLWVSGGFFDTLGVQPAIGRLLRAADDEAGGGQDGPVAVLGHRFWQRRFGGRVDVIGRPLEVDGVPYTIVGVAASSFFGMEVGRQFDVALPIGANSGGRGPLVRWLTVVGRLKPGQTAAAAEAALRTLQPRLREATMPANAAPPFRASYLQRDFVLAPAASGRSDLRRQYQRPLLAILAVVALVMLVACANLANLLLARAAARRRETCVRVALGASRWRVARPLFAEAALLAIGGAVLGVMLASWGSGALVRELGTQISTQSTTVFLDLSLDWRILAFTIGLTILTTLLFGALPAMRMSAVQPIEALKDGRSPAGAARDRLSSGLVVAQLTVSVVLVIAAGLFVRTFESLATRGIGFDPERVLTVSVSAQRAGVPADRRVALFERAAEAVRSLPAVTGAAASLMTPVDGLGLENRIEVSGGVPLPDERRTVNVNHVSPGWSARSRRRCSPAATSQMPMAPMDPPSPSSTKRSRADSWTVAGRSATRLPA